jgi:hypothetical protein
VVLVAVAMVVINRHRRLLALRIRVAAVVAETLTTTMLVGLAVRV